ncbi:MAG: hypothetical protein H0V92_10970 [Pseudonocardiales bacterium]|nr:hypothetical protein [Pseudonocardiales bacterium]
MLGHPSGRPARYCPDHRAPPGHRRSTGTNVIRAAPCASTWSPHDGSRAATDNLLVADRRGDVDALASLYDRTASLVYGLIRAAVADEATAEQITIRVYLRVWHTGPGYDPAHSDAMLVLLGAVCAELTGLGHPPLVCATAQVLRA